MRVEEYYRGVWGLRAAWISPEGSDSPNLLRYHHAFTVEFYQVVLFFCSSLMLLAAFHVTFYLYIPLALALASPRCSLYHHQKNLFKFQFFFLSRMMRWTFCVAWFVCEAWIGGCSSPCCIGICLPSLPLPLSLSISVSVSLSLSPLSCASASCTSISHRPHDGSLKSLTHIYICAYQCSTMIYDTKLTKYTSCFESWMVNAKRVGGWVLRVMTRPMFCHGGLPHNGFAYTRYFMWRKFF
ncbi:hypothetical protein FPV67DRAFT_298368 [Lyophyllum atratum]|nr:hypothetical protein FPV67DRAFT_298368 [Lyophyllum atratum]